MVLKAPVEIEMRKSKDGLGFNIKGGRDRKFIEARDPWTHSGRISTRPGCPGLDLLVLRLSHSSADPRAC